MNSVRRNLVKQGNSRCLVIPVMWRELLGWDEDQSLFVSFDGSCLRLSKPGVPKIQEPPAEEKRKRVSRRKSRAKDIVSAYMEHCSSEIGVIKVKDGMPESANIRKVVQIADRREKDRNWGEYFARVAKSQWLTGKKSSFKADLPWLLSDKAITAVDCGRYDNREHSKARTVGAVDFEAF